MAKARSAGGNYSTIISMIPLPKIAAATAIIAFILWKSSWGRRPRFQANRSQHLNRFGGIRDEGRGFAKTHRRCGRRDDRGGPRGQNHSLESGGGADLRFHRRRRVGTHARRDHP